MTEPAIEQQGGAVEANDPGAIEPTHPEPRAAQPDLQGPPDQTTVYPPSVGFPQPPYNPAPYSPTEPYGAYGPQNPGTYPPPSPDNPGAPAGYAEYRQEIGSDGMVRRVPVEPVHPEPTAPQPDHPPGGPIYSWAPPPPPTPPQQPLGYQPPPPPTTPSPAGPPAGGMQQGPGWAGEPNPMQPQSLQPHHGQQPGPPGQSVNELNLLKRVRRAPRGGWRRAVHKASGGLINPGESAADVVYRDLVERVNQPVRGDYRIAILSLKGGVGKTTTTVGLGSTFASLRGDRVIAIDANPDLGTLAHRVPRQTRSTVRNLLEDHHITRYSDVRAHTSQAPSRLEVLASEQDPAVSEAFSEADYRKALSILQSFYNIILTDCGTGLMHSAMAGVLDMASSLVLVTSPAIDGARSASATLDWLDHHGYSKLVERTVVVVNASRRGASTVDLDQLRKLFLDRTRAVQVVPFDDHLAEGAEIDLELVSKPTRQALLELAAMVADDFGYISSLAQHPYNPPGPPGM
ncbi:MinD/ParA family protein [Nocardia sp. CNY236]|uniref:MinD/ParA family ATP-binding protein n=1 Tax=Nocardia sp. CNY236 TaxID=1169152 RepID=UPI001E500A1C|nr:MinD/ParA family protein [Nocardia sp. CNY236]